MHTHTHAYIHIHSLHLTSRSLEGTRSAFHPTHCIRSITQRGSRPSLISTMGPSVYPCHFIFNVFPSPSLHLIWSKGHTRCTGTSSTCQNCCSFFCIYHCSPSIFYHAQSSFLTPHTFFFHIVVYVTDHIYFSDCKLTGMTKHTLPNGALFLPNNWRQQICICDTCQVFIFCSTSIKHLHS